jgi:Fe-S-cluster-containing dehydrogenase component
MSINRRQFLKIAGISTILGLSGATVINELSKNNLEASESGHAVDSVKKKRFGFVVDISKLKTEEDYQKCIDACHSIHNVPDIGNPKQEVKWIWKETFEHSFPGSEDKYTSHEFKERQFLLFCNHCEKPACVRVCPTKATFKRKDGVVMQDMHRCIGCRVCMAGCPYGARSFNFIDPRGKDAQGRPYIKKENLEFPTRTKGVVEKCTMCYERLAEGLQPACAEASNGAIVFGDLEDPNSEVRKIISSKYTIRRKPEVGTQPGIYYVIGGNDNA